MILLTGATGFVGHAVFTQFIQQAGLAIRTYGRRVPIGLQINTIPNAVHITGNIGGAEDYAVALCDVDVVIHCAALAHVMSTSAIKANKSVDIYRDVNVDGTIKLAQQAITVGVKRFVYVSSIVVNGTPTASQPFTANTDIRPDNSYAQSKYDAEVGLQKIAEETGLEVVIVRPTLVYGANAPGNFGMLTKLINMFPLLPFGLVNNKRDFIAVQNLADLLVVCATHPEAAGHTFLASDGKAVSIKDFTNAIAEGLNKKVIQLPIPVPLMHFVAKLLGKSTVAEQLLGNLEVDSSDANKILGWRPPFTMEQAMLFLKDNNK